MSGSMLIVTLLDYFRTKSGLLGNPLGKTGVLVLVFDKTLFN